jgi:hypothetical protein
MNFIDFLFMDALCACSLHGVAYAIAVPKNWDFKLFAFFLYSSLFLLVQRDLSMQKHLIKNERGIYLRKHMLLFQHLSIVGDVFSLKLLATTLGMSMGTRDNKLSLGMSISWGQQTSRKNNNKQCGNAMKNTLTKRLTCLKDRHLVQSFFQKMIPTT